MGDFGKGLSAFKKGVASDGADKETAQQGQPGDSAKPIEAQTSTSSPNQARQDNTAKV
jgi:sec-independent protein translocase protein TatA